MKTKNQIKTLVIAFIMLFSIVGAKAQFEPSFTEYDTVLIYEPQMFAGWPRVYDVIRHSLYTDSFEHDGTMAYIEHAITGYASVYASFQHIRLKNMLCDDTVPYNYWTYDRPVVGAYRNPFATAYAQAFHLDSTCIIAGVSLHSKGNFSDHSINTHKIYLLDTDYTEISRGMLHTENISYRGLSYTYRGGEWNNYYFQSKNGEYPQAKDFLIGFDVGVDTNAGTFGVNHTCRIDDDCLRDVVAGYGYNYDTIFVGRIPRDLFGYIPSYEPYKNYNDTLLEQVVDTIPLCPYNGEPYFRDNDGVWHSFAEDSIFYMYRNIFISALPIILVPRQDTNSSIENFDINDYCQVYPNPTTDYVEVMCNYKIYDIEITDINGRKLNKFSVDNFMTEIDLSCYPKGIYLLTLNTSKGKSTKKVIKQ